MALVDVKVPQLSESVAEATLLQWKKKVGDSVAVDEILIEVETDKVVMEVPAPSAGVIVEILEAAGSTVAAEQLIARISTEAVVGAVATSGKLQKIRIPDISDFYEVTVIEILVKKGDSIRDDQSLITVESDKAAMEIPSSHAGVVAEVHVKLGDKVKAGSVVLTLRVGDTTSTSPTISVEKVAKTPVISAQSATKFKKPAEQKQEAAGVLDDFMKRYGALMWAGVVTELKQYKFLWVTDGKNLLLLDVSTGLLWDGGYAGQISESESVTPTLEEQQKALNFGVWRLPSRAELVRLSRRPECAYREGANFLLFSQPYWNVKEGVVDVEDGYSDSVVSPMQACLLPVNDAFKGNIKAFISHAAKAAWKVKDTQGNKNFALLDTKLDIQTQFQSIDTRSAPLPPLDAAQFTDPHKGLWEFWGLNAQGLQQLGVRARNPAADVRDCNVAIDFGTSSTVVAYDDNGSHKLLRIGVTDWSQAIKTAHYENPTVLEFVDFAAMLTPWHSEAYRPGVLWDDVRCSHEALHNFRNNETKPEVVASVLTKIKQWALREGNGTRLRITDQTHRDERELDALTLRQPVKGRPLEVSATDPFDPVELYAWFLGLTINWRGRGLFLRYYMTFPVAYQKEVKEKVLASFRRGLQRSLPASLIGQPEFEQFTVEERASEPAAYAATALPCLGIEPTAEGVAYAVFDFGGGTTDFDFGYYRLPTETEADDAGWESVFEHFGSGGDAFLGGENLLEHLAYRTFCHNIEVCRSHKITFIQPLDAQDFPGSERFLERSQAAATNTLMLMARLRPFWETGIASNKTGIEKIDLLGRDGKKLPCELLIPLEALNQFLQERIEIGVRNFYAALKKAFANQPPDQVQVLLAGNASRSSIVQGFFGLLGAAKPPATLVDGAAARVRRAATPALGDEAANPLAALQRRADEFVAGLFGQQPPVFIVHPPLAADESDVYRPTGKTGVALGLLRLCPGSPTLVIHQAERNQMGDAPFLHYIGRIRLGKFHVCLPQGAPYQQWVELGPVRERVFVLVHSQEPRASLGEMKEGDIGLQQKRLDLAGNTTGLRVYGRAVSPHEIDLCTAASAVAAAAGQIENLRRIKLG